MNEIAPSSFIPHPSSLQGKRIVVTRAAVQAKSLVDMIEAHGGVPVLFPTIRTAAVRNNVALKNAIANLERYDWLVFTSGNAVKFFVRAAGGWPLAAGLKVACVGVKTAEALAKYGVVPDVVPEEFVGERVAAEMGDVVGQRVLIPQSVIARPALAQALTAAGAQVEAIDTYQTVPDMPRDEAYDELEKGVEVVTFTSPSTVENFLYLTGRRGREILAGAVIGCIGPTTAGAVNEAGFAAVVPEVYTVEGMMGILEAYFRSGSLS